jgi:Predicted amidophosphoribosyltransferases
MRLGYFLDFFFPKTGGRDIHTYLPAGYFSSTERSLRKMLVTNETLVQEVWVALDYNLHWVRELIHRAKFEGEFAIAEDLAEVLYLSWQAENNDYQPDLVTYVPWDPVRLVQRGYHLPEKIAQSLANRLNLPCQPQFWKKRTTVSQVNLSVESRKPICKVCFLLMQEWIVLTSVG